MKNVMAVCRFEIIHCLFLLLEFMCSSLSSLPAPHFFLFFFLHPILYSYVKLSGTLWGSTEAWKPCCPPFLLCKIPAIVTFPRVPKGRCEQLLIKRGAAKKSPDER